MNYREKFLNEVLDIVKDCFNGAAVYVYHHDNYVTHALIDGVDLYFLKQSDGTVTVGRT